MASTETEHFKDKIEVSLDGRQIFYLFFGGAVIATLVFVLGVMVGRRVESRSVAEAGSPQTDPLAALDRLEGGNALAFPTALRGDDVVLGSVDANLEGRLKLAQDQMATGGPQAQDAAVVATATGGKEDKSKAAAKAKTEIATREKDKAAAAEKRDAKQADKGSAEASEKEAKDVAPKAKRRFTLQVGSFQDKEEADTFFRGLSGSTYKPYMVEADVPGKGKYFRVRVGGYATYDEAVEAKGDFESNQHVIAYVTRLK